MIGASQGNDHNRMTSRDPQIASCPADLADLADLGPTVATGSPPRGFQRCAYPSSINGLLRTPPLCGAQQPSVETRPCQPPQPPQPRI